MEEPSQKICRTSSHTLSGLSGACLSIPAAQGSTNSMTVVQDGLGMKRDPIQKTPKTKKTGGVTQVAGHLSSKRGPEFKPKSHKKGNKELPEVENHIS